MHSRELQGQAILNSFASLAGSKGPLLRLGTENHPRLDTTILKPVCLIHGPHSCVSPQLHQIVLTPASQPPRTPNPTADLPITSWYETCHSFSIFSFRFRSVAPHFCQVKLPVLDRPPLLVPAHLWILVLQTRNSALVPFLLFSQSSPRHLFKNSST